MGKDDEEDDDSRRCALTRAAGEVVVAKTSSSPVRRWVNGANAALLEIAAKTNRNARPDRLTLGKRKGKTNGNK